MSKIFMVEDDEIIVEIYKQKIEAEGYTVEVATDGETAFKKIMAFKPDLLLLDLMLPGISGIDLLKMLRSEPDLRKLPIIAFSGAESSDLLDEAERLGATRVLAKGQFSPSQIVARITETLVAHPPQREFIIQDLTEWMAEAGPTTRRGRVLVVDDDPLILTLIKDIMEGENYEVLTAADGREAYRILKSDNDFVAAMFDINMPFIEGTDLVRHMKTEKRLMTIPIIIMTSDESLHSQSKSLSAGAAVFISKPFTRASLKASFSTIVESQPLLALRP